MNYFSITIIVPEIRAMIVKVPAHAFSKSSCLSVGPSV